MLPFKGLCVHVTPKNKQLASDWYTLLYPVVLLLRCDMFIVATHNRVPHSRATEGVSVTRDVGQERESTVDNAGQVREYICIVHIPPPRFIFRASSPLILSLCSLLAFRETAVWMLDVQLPRPEWGESILAPYTLCASPRAEPRPSACSYSGVCKHYEDCTDPR